MPYRSEPVQVEAYRMQNAAVDDAPPWIKTLFTDGALKLQEPNADTEALALLDTPDMVWPVEPGDWIAQFPGAVLAVVPDVVFSRLFLPTADAAAGHPAPAVPVITSGPYTSPDEDARAQNRDE